jgi:[acyl-carrier-protein] S-malonyltransferase
MRDIVLVFPGQGSQKPGMGQDLADAHPAAAAAFAAVDAALGESLSAVLWGDDADALTRTHNAQPALLAHGAAVWAVLRDAVGPRLRAAAGHSLGEFTAYHAVGALPLADAVRLVRRRGTLMYETGVARPGAMAALLGTLERPVEALCAEAEDAGVVVPANYNADEQIVVSGEVAAVERVMELAKAAGAKRAVRLPVSGAFHSPLMAPAATGLRDALAAAAWHEPAAPVVSNVDARPNTSPAAARDLLERQLTAPVRWVECVRTLAARHPGALVLECGPGAVLCGLGKRIAPELTWQACGTAAQVAQVLATL